MIERSFGIIPLRCLQNQWETLVVKHGKGHWAFPKGHSEKGEEAQETAVRELEEETGLQVMRFLPLEPLREFYHYQREGVLVEKHVTYYAAEVEGAVSLQQEEIADYRWVSLEEAEALVTFKEGKNLVRLLLIALKGDME